MVLKYQLLYEVYDVAGLQPTRAEDARACCQTMVHLRQRGSRRARNAIQPRWICDTSCPDDPFCRRDRNHAKYQCEKKQADLAGVEVAEMTPRMELDLCLHFNSNSRSLLLVPIVLPELGAEMDKVYHARIASLSLSSSKTELRAAAHS